MWETQEGLREHRLSRPAAPRSRDPSARPRRAHCFEISWSGAASTGDASGKIEAATTLRTEGPPELVGEEERDPPPMGELDMRRTERPSPTRALRLEHDDRERYEAGAERDRPRRRRPVFEVRPSPTNAAAAMKSSSPRPGGVSRALQEGGRAPRARRRRRSNELVRRRGHSGGTLGYVMDLCPGGRLRGVLGNSRKKSPCASGVRSDRGRHVARADRVGAEGGVATRRG